MNYKNSDDKRSRPETFDSIKSDKLFSDMTLDMGARKKIIQLINFIKEDNESQVIPLFTEITNMIRNEVGMIRMNKLNSNDFFIFASSINLMDELMRKFPTCTKKYLDLLVEFSQCLSAHGSNFMEMVSHKYYEFCSLLSLYSNYNFFNFLCSLAVYHVQDQQFIDSLKMISTSLEQNYQKFRMAHLLCHIIEHEIPDDILFYLISSLITSFPNDFETLCDYIKIGKFILENYSQPAPICKSFVIDLSKFIFPKFSLIPNSFQILAVEFITLFNKKNLESLILPPLPLISCLFDSDSENETIISIRFIQSILPAYYQDIIDAISLDLIWATIYSGICQGSFPMKIASLDFLGSLFSIGDPAFLSIISDLEMNELITNFLDSEEPSLMVTFFNFIHIIVSKELLTKGTFIQKISESDFSHFLEFDDSDFVNIDFYQSGKVQFLSDIYSVQNV